MADQPFLPSQGPGDFGPSISSASNCVIMNGKLGLSSHHGIHGNNNCDILCKRLTITKFEVGGIALNGINKLNIKDVCINGKFEDVPVLGIFSAAVFLRIHTIFMLTGANIDAKEDLEEKLLSLENAIDLAVVDILGSGQTIGQIDENRESTKVFINNKRTPDGTSYGILINGRGVAVGSYSRHRPLEFVSKNITIERTSIVNISGHVREIVALSTQLSQSNTNPSYNNTNVQTDTAGAVFQIQEVLGEDELYHGNVVSNLQIAMAKWSDPYVLIHDPVLAQYRADGKLGTLNIETAIVAWACPGIGYDGVGPEGDSFTINNTTPFSKVLQNTGIKYLGNGDSMSHVNKGFFGIRMDGVKDVKINCDINKILNKGDPGSNIPGQYTGSQDGGHLGQGAMYGYTGTDAYGINLSACQDVLVLSSSIKCVHSKNGSAYGININGDSYDTQVKGTEFHCISTNAYPSGKLPNKFPYSVACYIDHSSCNTILNENTISKITSKHVEYGGHFYIIDNNETIIH